MSILVRDHQIVAFQADIDRRFVCGALGRFRRGFPELACEPADEMVVTGLDLVRATEGQDVAQQDNWLESLLWLVWTHGAEIMTDRRVVGLLADREQTVPARIARIAAVLSPTGGGATDRR